MLVLSALWWAWAAYAWLTNYVAAEEDRERLLMLAVMGAFLVAALAAPEAFGDHALLFASPTRRRAGSTSSSSPRRTTTSSRPGDPPPARTAVPAPALLIAAAFLDGTAQTSLGGRAATDFRGPYVFGVRGFRVSPGHFAERFSLIVIIALGESIVAIGTGLVASSTQARRRRSARPGAGVRHLVGVLRRGRDRRRAAFPRAQGERRLASRATPTATSTCR